MSRVLFTFLAAGLVFGVGVLFSGVAFGACNENVVAGTTRADTCSALNSGTATLFATVVPALAIVIFGLLGDRKGRAVAIVAGCCLAAQGIAFVYLLSTAT